MSGLAQPLIWYAESGWYKMVVLQPLLAGEMLAGSNRCFSRIFTVLALAFSSQKRVIIVMVSFPNWALFCDVVMLILCISVL